MLRYIALTSLCFLSLQHASAGVILGLDASSTLVNSGDDVLVTMTLIDDGSVAGAGGLYSGTSRLLVNDGGTATATVDSASDISGNLSFANVFTVPFDAGFPEVAPAGFTNLAGINLSAGLAGAPVLPFAGEVFLASYMVTVTGSAGSSVTLTSSSIGTSFLGLIGADLSTVFDPAQSQSVTISIIDPNPNNPIPEPSSLAMWTLAAFIGISSRRRKRSRS